MCFAQVALFKGLRAESPIIASLADKMSERKVQRKELIVEKDTIGTEMYFVAAGMCREGAQGKRR